MVDLNRPIVSREEWLERRIQLLEKEKELTKMRDTVTKLRQELPWVKIDKDYTFLTEDREVSFVELFQGRNQLIVYHFMLAPDSDHICEGCALLADHFDSARQHFEHNDLTLTAVSRAKPEQIRQVKKRMGWSFPWFSSFGSTFNYDFGVSFTKEEVATGDVGYNYGTTPYANEDLHGTSVFYRKGDEIFHTYSTYARGAELLVGAFHYLDLTPKGRNEKTTMDWVRLHDEYPERVKNSCCGGSTSCCS